MKYAICNVCKAQIEVRPSRTNNGNMISLLNANAPIFIPCETTYTRSRTINHQADMFIPLTIRDEENRKIAIICAIILIISSFVIFEIRM